MLSSPKWESHVPVLAQHYLNAVSVWPPDGPVGTGRLQERSSSLWRASVLLLSAVMVIAVITWRNSCLHSAANKGSNSFKSHWECLLCGAMEQHLNRTYRGTVAETGKNAVFYIPGGFNTSWYLLCGLGNSRFGLHIWWKAVDLK